MKTTLTILLLSGLCQALTISGNQTVNITGRMGVGDLICLDNSVATVTNLTGYGQILSVLASGSSRVLFDVPVLNFSYQDGLYGAGTVSGVCWNGQAFACSVVDVESFNHIQQIPEPVSLVLWAVMGLMLKVKGDSAQSRLL